MLRGDACVGYCFRPVVSDGRARRQEPRSERRKRMRGMTGKGDTGDGITDYRNIA
jgi:hypothetical protein